MKKSILKPGFQKARNYFKTLTLTKALKHLCYCLGIIAVSLALTHWTLDSIAKAEKERVAKANSKFVKRKIIITSYAIRPDGRLEVLENLGGIDGILTADSNLKNVIINRGSYIATIEKKREKLLVLKNLSSPEGIQFPIDSSDARIVSLRRIE